ncbi:MAG: RIP metalloprotease RseP [Candidatus Magasanikbacteria bacterium]
MLTVIIFILVLGVLVLAHEFGHFIAARKSGMKVEEFGFGFPPRALGVRFLDNGKREWIWGNKESEGERTVYSINWLPIGGFVKIKGENGEAVVDQDSFMSKSAWKKTIVLAAGVVMNIVLAAVLLSVGYMIGLPQTTDDISDGTVVKDARVAILQVIEGKPAAQAGLKMGDEIIGIDAIKNPRIIQMQEYVDQNRDKEIIFTIARGQKTFEKNIIPTLNSDTGKGGIGVAIAEVGLVKYPWHKAIYYGVIATGSYLLAIVLAFWQLIAGLFVGKGAGSAVTGPVGIAVMTGQVARMGWAYLIQFTAMLSLNLAVINILPLPALDGGRILFTWLGKIFKKPVFMKFEQAAHTIGFMALLVLIFVVTAKDLWGFKSVFTNLWSKIF